MDDSNQTSPVFELDHLGFCYPDRRSVLSDITFTVQPGERLALLGANGSGKSTLQKILNGLLFPTVGTIRCFGQLLTEDRLEETEFAHWFHRRVGFIFQNSDAQLFSSTVSEEIAFGPMHMGYPLPEVATRVRDILELMELEALRDRPPYQLSGGEKKKVAIACVLATNPRVLILDEPTNGLDPRTQRWVIRILHRLSESGITLITATHHLDIVPELADRGIVISEAHQLIADRPIDQILQDKQLLLDVNLIDQSYHVHTHSGDHAHYHLHE